MTQSLLILSTDLIEKLKTIKYMIILILDMATGYTLIRIVPLKNKNTKKSQIIFILRVN
jgi:hypothetical protein